MTAMPARLQPVVQAVLRAVNAMSALAAPAVPPAAQAAPPRPTPAAAAVRPPQQKFTNFEEYMNAHGGATAPIEDHSDEV